MKTRRCVEHMALRAMQNAKQDGDVEVRITNKLLELKINEALLYAISQQTNASSYEMFEYFHNYSHKIMSLFSTPKYNKRDRFSFYGTYGNSNSSYILTIKRANYTLKGIDSSGNVVVDYDIYEHLYGIRTIDKTTGYWIVNVKEESDETVARINHIEFGNTFIVNVNVPAKFIHFNSEKISEIVAEKELLGFSALAEPEDPSTSGKRRSIDELDKMIEEAQPIRKRRVNKERGNV